MQKQIDRLTNVLNTLQKSSISRPSNVTNKTRPVVLVDARPRSQRRHIVPVDGRLVIQKLPRPTTQSQKTPSKRHIQPLYKWEQRRPTQFMPVDMGESSRACSVVSILSNASLM